MRWAVHWRVNGHMRQYVLCLCIDDPARRSDSEFAIGKMTEMKLTQRGGVGKPQPDVPRCLTSLASSGM